MVGGERLELPTFTKALPAKVHRGFALRQRVNKNREWRKPLTDLFRCWK